MGRRAWAVIGLYALLALLVVPVYPHFSSPNEFTRWAAVAAVVEDHTLEVSRVATLLGPGFEDLAVVGGRQYSNKAPGLALVSSIGYLLARPFAGPPARENLRLVLTSMRWFGATIPLLLLALAFLREGKRRGLDPTFAVATLLFATPLFAYGLLLFSHALVGAALFGAWLLLYVDERWELAAGALIGIAVTSEYPAVFAALVLVGGLAVTRQWRRLALVVAGGAPFAIALAVYQRVIFGGLFSSPYFEKNVQYQELARSGLFGVQLPNPVILAKMLLHPARGLLLFSPILLACAAAVPACRRALGRPAFLTLVSSGAAIVLVYSGYPNWHGGWNLGPRYLVSALPLFVFPILWAEVRWWHAVLFGMSVAAVTLTALTFPFVPLDFPIPWGTLALPLLRDGLAAPNLLHWVARPAAIAVPLLLVAALLAVACKRKWPLAIAGAALTLLLGAAVPQSPRAIIERTYFEDVYFQQRGKLDALVQRRIANPTLLMRRETEERFGPGEWPF